MRLCIVLFLLIPFLGISQKKSSQKPNALEIYNQIEKLNFLGSALYIAAHPDDENTRLLAYLSNELNARTAYLSLTRGDGGQNLIGTEIREELGLLRTHELLEARATDGGQQFFSRANDFGYSKHPDETFNIWNKEIVLEDMVNVIRNFKPDIIINRFDHRTPGRTHGHHTGSAMLSREALLLAADDNAYINQLERVGTWSATRLFFNTSWWFYGSREKFAEADKSNLLSVDIGVYDPMLGTSVSEIATRARSKHLSQGFGSTPRRGSYQEWVEFIDGSKPNSKEDLFEGINTTWSRIPGGESIGQTVQQILDGYNFKNPAESLDELIKVRKMINALFDQHWKTVKLQEIDAIIENVCGLYLEAISDIQMISPGDSLEIAFEITNRSSTEMQLESIEVPALGIAITEDKVIENNVENRWYEVAMIPKDMYYTTPYWLDLDSELGFYSVEDKTQLTLARRDNKIKALFNMNIEGSDFKFEKEIVFKKSDPAKGEIYRPFEVIPHVFVAMDKDVFLFADDNAQEVDVTLMSNSENIQTSVSLELPDGWTSNPISHEVSLSLKSESQKVRFQITPPATQSTGTIRALAQYNGTQYDKTLKTIEYDHVPFLTMTSPCKSKLVRVPLEKNVTKVGYILGAGDKVPESLRNVGYDVQIIELSNIDQMDLSQFDAILLGIRIYNVNEEINLYQNTLFDYAANGGVLIAQYNTSRRLKVDQIAPYDLKLSRDRVTDEQSGITFINPNHKVLNTPNKITQADFEGWVQERGLYFPNEWGPEFETIIECNDQGEDPKQGSLLIAPHGEGYYVYTGLSWFRELPAGVPGAYRLLANIIALGND